MKSLEYTTRGVGLCGWTEGGVPSVRGKHKRDGSCLQTYRSRKEECAECVSPERTGVVTYSKGG